MPRIPLPRSLTKDPFTYAEARAMGVGRRRLYGPDLHRPFHGIRTHAVPADVRALAQALAPRLPDDAFFCSVTAAQLSGVPLPLHIWRKRELHVAVPAPGRALRLRGVKGHVLQATPECVVERQGLRLSGPEMLWLELGAVLALDDLVAAGDHLVHWRWPATNIARVRSVVASASRRRGLVLLREAVELLDDHSESPQESRLRVHLCAQGMTGLVANLRVTTIGGYSYRIDLALVELKVAIEYQGGYHNDPAQFRRDMTKRERLEAEGWIVMWVNADDLRDPQELAARIRRKIWLRSGR
ncbi:DUF559 domain-containing protein [Salinibacterium sp. SYSU T00001]|uniref:endonuclease domain-containing protein n=1 Tax=Homoserinimonas sedimenticola TaxID=2986805 RepID=UPI002235813F|nr:DUF559 domain-containing protein [Salinibacterium sedimenticola]MCW4385972.1 DUF559 domain-containing protein [Salinibacterium sedimenticola]